MLNTRLLLYLYLRLFGLCYAFLNKLYLLDYISDSIWIMYILRYLKCVVILTLFCLYFVTMCVYTLWISRPDKRWITFGDIKLVTLVILTNHNVKCGFFLSPSHGW